MSVDKVILRAVLSTLAAIGALLIFMVSALCIAFPSTMMGITYSLGMEASSIHFAERAYKGSEDVYFLGYATEVAIEEDKTDKILSCGQQLIAHDEFAAFCEKKGDNAGAYKRFIYGQVCVAKYRSNDKQGAVETAYDSLNGEFKSGNPLIAVMMAAITAQDKDTVRAVLDKLALLSAQEEDQNYLNETIAWANEYLG